MLTNMDTLATIRAFVAVADTGSFTAAAERLGLSRALTSKYVAHLENRLGTRLLNRTTRHVEMNSAGRAYRERVVLLLSDFDDLEGAVRDRRETPSGRLRIAAPVTFTERFLPLPIAEFTDRFPEVSLELSLSDRQVDVVAEGFDVAVRIGNLVDSSLIARRLAGATSVICAAPDYLERRGVPNTLAELATHRCVLDDNLQPRGLWSLLIYGKRQSVAVHGPVCVNSAGIVRSLVLAGQGIGLCPSFMVAGDIRSKALVPLFAAHRQPEIGIHAVYAHNRHLSSAVRAFIDHLADRLPTLCER